MPIINSEFKPYRALSNPDMQTILPALFRYPAKLSFQRETITTPDDDFLDIDWHKQQSQNLLIISHGMEGSTQSSYVHGFGTRFVKNGFDILAWNFRGCSGVPNKLKRFYNSGCSDDLECVVQHALKNNQYSSIYLLGVSVGGNVTLKFLGEQASRIDPRIKKAFALSVPCDLRSSAEKMAEKRNWIYMRRFLNDFKKKMQDKQKMTCHDFDLKGYEKIKTFLEFDDRYTAPLNGYTCAYSYWEAASCKPHLPNIKIPTLLLSAGDDPFLAPQCYPFEEAKDSSYFYFENSQYGGHVGFLNFHSGISFWSEHRAICFFAA